MGIYYVIAYYQGERVEARDNAIISAARRNYHCREYDFGTSERSVEFRISTRSGAFAMADRLLDLMSVWDVKIGKVIGQ